MTCQTLVVRYAKDAENASALNMDLDLANDDYFLCSWNGTEITQIHTKESLIEEYKETGLIEDNDWSWGALGNPQDKWYYGTVIELMDFLIEGVWLFKEYHNDNMTIMYIKTKE
tara:strand:- start:2799 stop:3140 length:342 start_codon:yes stop_codon:yes gene_type:complete